MRGKEEKDNNIKKGKTFYWVTNYKFTVFLS